MNQGSVNVRAQIVTNYARLRDLQGDYEGLEVRSFSREPKTIWTICKLFFKSRKSDYLILDFADSFWSFAAMKLLMPLSRIKLVTVDLLVADSHTLRDRLEYFIKRILLGRAYKFLVHQRNTAMYQSYFSITADKFYYLPFKVNGLEIIKSITPTDQGYVFCGGKSRRDFPTLIEAARSLPYPVTIVTTGKQDLAHHGSYLQEANLPPNVTPKRLAGIGQALPFIQYMAASRLVVIPLLKNAFTQAGIAVYLQAMALGKCVIISAGPGIEDVIPADCAIIVPPGNPDALREAIRSMWLDDSRRESIAANGKRYALGLGGEERLFRDIIRWAIDDRQASDAKA